jgi:hypothetical protein
MFSYYGNLTDVNPVILLCGSERINKYSLLFYSILFYSILFYSILFYSILFYSILFYSTLARKLDVLLLKNYYCFLLFTISNFITDFLDFTDLQHEVEIADVVSETHPAVPVPTTATANPIPSTTSMLVPAVAQNLCFDTVVRADPMSRQ